MRRKKHKNTRRTVRFFRISHGFKEPFKVAHLLDFALKCAFSTNACECTLQRTGKPFRCQRNAHTGKLPSQASESNVSQRSLVMRTGFVGWELPSCIQACMVRCLQLEEGCRVLLPPTFDAHATGTASSQGQAPLADALAKLLGSAVKLFTSKCITRELREMGEETQGLQPHVVVT